MAGRGTVAGPTGSELEAAVEELAEDRGAQPRPPRAQRALLRDDGAQAVGQAPVLAGLPEAVLDLEPHPRHVEAVEHRAGDLAPTSPSSAQGVPPSPKRQYTDEVSGNPPAGYPPGRCDGVAG